MVAQVEQPRLTFLETRDLSGRNPPHHMARLAVWFEPLEAAAKVFEVLAPVGEVLELLDGFPDGVVDEILGSSKMRVSIAEPLSS